ncbi:hypothetical protein KAI87_05825, partial [Myxococcota bacterium]|nr:hypothetical protein [Myxococcota bacterium]
STDELRQMLGELHELDQTIIREMRATSVFGQVGDTVFARILPLLARRRTVLNGEPLRFADEPLHPRLSVEMVPFKGMRVRLQLETEEGVRFSVAQGKLMAGSVAYFLTPQALFEIDSRAPWELGSWAKTDFRDLPSEASVAVRDEFVSGLKNLGVPPEDLLQLAVRRAPPDEIELTLSAIIETSVGPRVNGTLRIRYGAIWAEIENRRPASPYLDGDQSAGVVERDLVMEESARATLKAASFKYEKSQDRFVCLGDPALQLFDKERSPLPAHWTLIHQSEAPVLRRNLRLDAQIELRADEGLVDVSVGIAAEEDEVVRELVEIKDLLKWLHSGQQYLLLSDGSYIAPSKEMRERLAVVEDLGLESGRALLSPMCVGLLRKLGDHEALRISDEATRAWLDEVTGRETPAPVPIPKGLQIPLRDYQQHGLDWLYMLHRHRLTGILADDMGLGKTAQALVLLALAKEREGPQPSLIIAPTSVIGVWRDEAARFLPDLKVGLWQGTPEERRSMKVEDYDLVVTS